MDSPAQPLLENCSVNYFTITFSVYVLPSVAMRTAYTPFCASNTMRFLAVATRRPFISKIVSPAAGLSTVIVLPDTATVGRKLAKVTLRLADETLATVFVPVEVVESSKEDKQQNNTQEDSKPAAEPSKNSEQPAVNQTEDVKENPSTTSQESKASNQKVLPNTGTGNEISIFGSAAMTVLASLGLVATSKKKEE